VLIPFLEFAAINYASDVNVKCMQVDSQMKLVAVRDIKREHVIV